MASIADELYKSWVEKNSVPVSNDYDMRGFFEGLLRGDSHAMQGINPNDKQMHFSDFWKLPNHPSFSTESRYYDPKTMPQTPSWQGGEIDTPQARALGAESWTLRRPNGQIVVQEAPWKAGK